MPVKPRQRQQGIVLALVLMLMLFLSVTAVTFARRALIDTMIVRNRDKVAETEALARAGIEIAKAILTDQRWRKIEILRGSVESDEIVGNTKIDLWSRVQEYELTTPEGASLRLTIMDNRSRLNLNSLVQWGTLAPPVPLTEIRKEIPELQGRNYSKKYEAKVIQKYLAKKKLEGPERDEEKEGKPLADAEEFLVDFLDRVIENMNSPTGDTLYEPRELARNLLDYMDSDDTGIDGGDENDYYHSRDPPYRPANRPMLSTNELGLVEGFDPVLVEALQPYVTVYPLMRAKGVNLNTAPAHVLGSVFHGGGGSQKLLDETEISQILSARAEGRFICDETETDSDRCITLEEAGIETPIFPPGRLPATTFVYTVHSEVVMGDIERGVVAVFSMVMEKESQLLFWRMQ